MARGPLDTFYIFCDESIVNLEGAQRFLTAHIAVPQELWNRVPKSQRDLIEPVNLLQLDRIKNLLEYTNGLAVIAYADVLLLYLPPGETDSTNDIVNMSRTNHIWSVAIAFGLAATFKWLTLHGLSLGTFDIYYDTHSLKIDHRAAWGDAVTKRLPGIIHETTNKEEMPVVRHFCDTPKPPKGRTGDNFQAGIAVCDWLLDHASEVITAGDQKRIHIKDNSKNMIAHLKAFSLGNSGSGSGNKYD